jgi:omega-hydroxy-beta-dihydromenaquinone-9 sulfotransferase
MRRKSFRYPVTSLAGSTPGNTIWLLKRYRVEPRYYFKVALSFIVALIFSPLTLAERVFLKKSIRNYRIEEPPLFIIGFNRSGTTLLHNLLCQDKLAGFTTTFHTVFPHIVLSQRRWLKPFINSLVPAKRPFDNVSMDMGFPQEEEFAMANLQHYSVYNFFLFPDSFDTFLDLDYRTGSLPVKDLEIWKEKYREMVVKSLINTGGTRYVSKNPHNIPRTAILKEMFPGSRFIFIYRDPYVVVESFYNFILAIFPGVQLQKVTDSYSRKTVARFYSIAMKTYFDERKRPGSVPVLEIKMEEFLKDITGGLRNIYDTLGLGGFEENLPRFRAFLENNPRERGKYTVHADTIRYVNEYALEFVEKLGYPVRSIPSV